MEQRRIQKRIRATGLSVSVWSRDKSGILGHLDGTTWVEFWTQLKASRDCDWQDMKADVRLMGTADSELQRTMCLTEFEYYVTMTVDAQQYSGNVLVKNSSNGDIDFHVQGGFEQDIQMRPR